MPATSSQHDRYLLHLNHALAMESAMVDHLEKRARSTPGAAAKMRLRRHRDEAVEHRDALRDIILSLHGEPTAAKAVVQPPIAMGWVGKVMAVLEGEREDRQLQHDLSDYALEQYEAAIYSALMLMARNLGFAGQAARFEAIRQQEREMAEYFAAILPAAVRASFPPIAQAA